MPADTPLLARRAQRPRRGSRSAPPWRAGEGGPRPRRRRRSRGPPARLRPDGPRIPRPGAERGGGSCGSRRLPRHPDLAHHLGGDRARSSSPIGSWSAAGRSCRTWSPPIRARTA